MPQISSQVIAKLHALRRSISAWILVRGLAIVLAVFVAILALSLWLDWTWMLDKQQRVICIILALAALGYLAYRNLLKPLSRRLDDETLALRVEGRHAELHEGLINALQFSRIARPQDLGLSPAMVTATIESGNSAAAAADFRDVLNRKAYKRNLLITGIALLVLGAGAVGVAYSETLGIWFDRMFLLGDIRYPRDTNFDLGLNEKNELVLPRGDDWEAAVKVTGEVPSSVYIDYQPRTGSSVTQLMARQGDDAARVHGKADFAATFKNIIEEFEFRIRGGDNRTDWIPVRLVDRPAIETFDLTLAPPQYTARVPQVVWSIRPARVATTSDGKAAGASESRSGTSSIAPIKGSTLRFTAQTNKPLAAASLKWDKGEMPLTLEPVILTDEDGQQRQATRFSAELTPEQLVSATYAISLVDTEGLESKRPTRFIVRLRADKEPVVKAQLLGISSMIVPEARVPIQATFRDDYAVTAAALHYQFRGETEQAAAGGAKIPFTDVNLIEHDVTELGYTHVHNWEVGPLKLPIGSNLTFYVEAADNDTISGPKTGKSTAFFVRVVDQEELRAELVRREQEQRQEFERLIKTQDDLIAESRIVIASGGTESNLPARLRQSLLQSQKRQKLAADRCKAIARQYENIRLEFGNNKLDTEDGPVQTRLRDHVIKPLYVLGDESAILATNMLDAARKAPDGATREQMLQEAVEQQMKVAAEMREVLKHMVRWSNYQEAVNLLYTVMTTQGQVNKDTFRAHQARLEGIFGGGDDKVDKPDKPAPPKP